MMQVIHVMAKGENLGIFTCLPTTSTKVDDHVLDQVDKENIEARAPIHFIKVMDIEEIPKELDAMYFIK